MANINIKNFVNISIVSKGQVVNYSSADNNFTINLSYNSSGGTVIASSLKGEVGEQVTLTISPNVDYSIYSIKINGISQSIKESITFNPKSGTNNVIVIFKSDTITEKLETPVIRLEEI